MGRSRFDFAVFVNRRLQCHLSKYPGGRGRGCLALLWKFLDRNLSTADLCGDGTDPNRFGYLSFGGARAGCRERSDRRRFVGFRKWVLLSLRLVGLLLRSESWGQ